MPQLTRMTMKSGLFLNFKCPYHANVMKTFEKVSSTMGSQRDWVRSLIESRVQFRIRSAKQNTEARACRYGGENRSVHKQRAISAEKPRSPIAGKTAQGREFVPPPRKAAAWRQHPLQTGAGPPADARMPILLWARRARTGCLRVKIL